MKAFLAAVAALALAASLGVAQDELPTLEIKADDPAKLTDGSFAVFTVKADLNKGDKVYWSVYPDPIRRAGVGNSLFVSGVKGTEYRIEVRVVNLTPNTLRYDEGVSRFTFGGKVVTPPPVITPPPANAKYYFAVVWPNGARTTPEYKTLMADPGWAQLKSLGHTSKAFTAAEAATFGIDPGTTPLPAVVTLLPSADGKTSLVARPPIPAPSNTVGIVKLAEFK